MTTEAPQTLKFQHCPLGRDTQLPNLLPLLGEFPTALWAELHPPKIHIFFFFKIHILTSYPLVPQNMTAFEGL